MPHEPTLTPPQRAEWASWMEGWRHLSTTDGLEGSSATVLAVNAYLHHLEADHARLVEENRRLRWTLGHVSRWLTDSYHVNAQQMLNEVDAALTSPETPAQ